MLLLTSTHILLYSATCLSSRPFEGYIFSMIEYPQVCGKKLELQVNICTEMNDIAYLSLFLLGRIDMSQFEFRLFLIKFLENFIFFVFWLDTPSVQNIRHFFSVLKTKFSIDFFRKDGISFYFLLSNLIEK